MALDIILAADTINALENFLDKRRPPAEIRHQVDLDYRIDNQSLVLFEVRPHWKNKNERKESPIAKATWVHTQKCWKIFWMPSDLKWHSYEPIAEVKTIEEFIQVVDTDAHGCFWG